MTDNAARSGGRESDPTSEMLRKLARACELNGYVLTVHMRPRAKARRIPGVLKVKGSPHPANRPRLWSVVVQKEGEGVLWAQETALKAAAESVRAQLRNRLKGQPHPLDAPMEGK